MSFAGVLADKVLLMLFVPLLYAKEILPEEGRNKNPRMIVLLDSQPFKSKSECAQLAFTRYSVYTKVKCKWKQVYI